MCRASYNLDKSLIKVPVYARYRAVCPFHATLQDGKSQEVDAYANYSSKRWKRSSSSRRGARSPHSYYH